MVGKTKRAALILTLDQKTILRAQASSRTVLTREIGHTKVLIGYAHGILIAGLQRLIVVSRPMIYKCIDKALAGFPCLTQAGRSTVWHILDENEIKPHNTDSTWKEADPDFNRKIQEVLLVYRDVSILLPNE